MRKLIFLLVMAVSVFVACKKSDKTNVDPPKDALKSIRLSDTLTMFTGQTRALAYTLIPLDYRLDLLKFKSTDSSVVTVTTLGVLLQKRSFKRQ